MAHVATKEVKGVSYGETGEALGQVSDLATSDLAMVGPAEVG